MFYTVEQVTTEATVYTASMSWYTVSLVTKKSKDHALLNEHVVETTIESSLQGSSAAELRMYADAMDQVEAGIEWGYLDEPTPPALEPEPLPEGVPTVDEMLSAPAPAPALIEAIVEDDVIPF